MSQGRSHDHADEALILTICMVGGVLLIGGWFVWSVVVPRLMSAVVAALN
jgi:hypothetical protein